MVKVGKKNNKVVYYVVYYLGGRKEVFMRKKPRIQIPVPKDKWMIWRLVSSLTAGNSLLASGLVSQSWRCTAQLSVHNQLSLSASTG